MSPLGFVDLHCHWVAGIDDGVRTFEDSEALLSGLYDVGFSHVVATPHMRPGMFANDKYMLEEAFAQTVRHLEARPEEAARARPMPKLELSSEHFFDDVVFDRLRRGEGVPYPLLDPTKPPRHRRALVEFNPMGFPYNLAARLVELRRAGIAVVIAHPERYQPVWKDDACLDPLLDAGATLLLDACAVVGKYGRAAQKAAEKLLEEDAYEAACSDAHRPEDAPIVGDAIATLRKLVGDDEVTRLFRDGPRAILSGTT